MTSIMNKHIRVEMPDGSLWDVPVSIIARNRATYYAKKDSEFMGNVEMSLAEDTIPLFEEEFREVIDWACNNMDWCDVEEYAVIAKPAHTKSMYRDGWANGNKKMVSKGECLNGHAHSVLGIICHECWSLITEQGDK